MRSWPCASRALAKACGDLLVRRHVDLAENAADLARDLLAALDVAVEDGDLGPAPRELARRRLAEARRRAGHDRGHSIDVHFIPNPLAFRDAYSTNLSEDKAGRKHEAALGSSQFRHSGGATGGSSRMQLGSWISAELGFWT